jgi:hypothetical protein
MEQRSALILRTLRPWTQIAVFFFIVVIEVPFLTFLCLRGASALGSEDFMTFMRDYKTTVYGGAVHFSLGDILNGNLWLMYVSCGFIVAVLSGWRLARHFQYRDFTFYSEVERTTQRKAAASPEYEGFLHNIGYAKFQAVMFPSKTTPEWGNVLRAFLWALAFVPIWPVLLWWVTVAEVPKS